MVLSVVLVFVEVLCASTCDVTQVCDVNTCVCDTTIECNGLEYGTYSEIGILTIVSEFTLCQDHQKQLNRESALAIWAILTFNLPSYLGVDNYFIKNFLADFFETFNLFVLMRKRRYLLYVEGYNQFSNLVYITFG